METLQKKLLKIESLSLSESGRIRSLAEAMVLHAQQQHQPYYEAQGQRYLSIACNLEGNQSAASEHADCAVAICREKLSDQRLLLLCTYTRGSVYLSQGFNQQARELYEHYLPQTQSADLQDIKGKYLNNLGIVLQRLGDYPEALDCFLQCLKIRRKYGSDIEVAYTLHNVAEIYNWLEMYEPAEANNQEGLAILRENGELHGQAHLLNGLGTTVRELGDRTRAMKLHEEAIAISRRIGDQSELAHSMSLRVQCTVSSQPRDADLAVLSDALGYARNCEDKHLQAGLILQLAEYHLLRDDADQALLRLREVEELTSTTAADELVLRARKLLSQAYASKGDYEKAYKHLSDYDGLAEKFKGAKVAQKLRAITTTWELRVAEAEKEMLRLRNAELENISHHDYLTGLANRWYLQQEMEAKSHQTQMSLMIIDIDYFKLINDRYSHATGDEVLCHCGSLLRDFCPTDAVAARFGGEEFVILLPDTDLQDTRAQAEQLRHRFETYHWSDLAKELKVTVSIGIAHRSEETKMEAVLQLADTRLYHAKRSGRNKVASTL